MASARTSSAAIGPGRAAWRALGLGGIALIGCIGSNRIAAAPYTPAHDDVVVQHLPARLERAERHRLASLAREPLPLPIALATARAAIERARLQGDPREWGLAQAALMPWWSQADAPPAVRLLRATVLQGGHRFEAALADFEALDGRRPSLPAALWLQASLGHASLLQLMGRRDEAHERCRQLVEAREAAISAEARLVARACIAELDSLRGKTAEADAAFADLAREAPQNAWLSLLRAERAERAGRADEALRLYRTALLLRPDVYTRAAAADALLAAQRPREALELLQGAATQADALRLRRAIAWHRLGDPRAQSEARALREDFAASARRGEALHQREEARLLLDVGGDARTALALAQRNWALQKEPADVLLLWRAAHAAGVPAAAEPVGALLRAGWQDARLAAAPEPGDRRP